MRSTADWLFSTLGYRFNNEKLLEAALTHRSAGGSHYERLEFLGDSILNFVIAEALYHQLPDAPEGDLSRQRSSLVKGTTLARIATEIGLGDHLSLGAGELKSGGFRRTSILADALEALIGAVYLDSGFAVTAKTIQALFDERLQNLPSAADLKDPKTRLQEWMQAKGLPLPQYTVQGVSGKSHKQTFNVLCEAPGLPANSQGEGSSRRRAEQAAAAALLERLEAQTQSQ